MAHPGVKRARGRITTSTRLLRAALVIAILTAILPGRPADAQVATCFTTPAPPLPTEIGVGPFPISVAMGDLNGDGRLDLAVANQNSTTVSIRLGSGNGTFIIPSTSEILVGQHPRGLALGDLNNDGRLDLAVTNENSNSVSIRLGVGDGTFSPSTSELGVGTRPHTVAIGDLDRNGTPDLAVSNENSSTVSIRLGIGDGTFTTPSTSEVAVGTRPHTVAIGDFNADGWADFAVANFNSGTVSIRLGVGAGTFTAPSTSEVAVGSGPTGVELRDLDGDHRLDFAVTNVATNTVSIRLGRGDGTFGDAGTNPPDVGVGSQPISVAIGDLNDDGNLDLAVANNNAGTISIRLGTGTGAFTDAATSAPNVGVAAPPYAVALGDLNGDGNLDLVVPNIVANTVPIRLGNGNGTFGSTSEVGTGDDPRAVAVGDLNGDLKPDLAIANEVSHTVSIRQGNGNGTFATTREVPVGLNPHAVAIADLDGDGNLDLAVANRGSGNVSIRLGTGTGAFTSPSSPEVSFGSGPHGIAIADLNGDGRLDLAVANINDNTVVVRLGTGGGTFGTASVLAVQANPVAVAIGDLNGDGRLDLAAANHGANSVSILLGTGTGTFGSATNVSVGWQPWSVGLGDFNADGRLDLVTPNARDDTVSIRLGSNTVPGTFTSTGEVKTGAGGSPRTAAIGDLNGDGRLDLAVANFSTGTVAIRLGSGTGSFDTAADIRVGNGPLSIALGQLNADGKLDIVVGNHDSDNVSIRLNTCGQDLVPQPRVPGAQTVPEDGMLVFSPTNGTAVTVTDDGRSTALHVTLAAASGTLTLGTTAGLRFTSGDGTTDPTMTFSGTLAQVNTALTSLGFTPAAQYSGPAGLTITVHDDGHAGGAAGPTSGVATVPIAVTPVNDAPTAVNDTYTVGAQTPLVVPAPGVLANDTDADSAPASLTAAVVVGPTNGTLSLAQPGGFTYTPNPGFAGPDSFTYRVSDGTAQSGPATVTISVGNGAPLAGNDTFTVTAGTPLKVAAPGLLANDIDSDSPALTAITLTEPTRGSLTLNADGGFAYTPSAGFTGSDSFTYRASDGIAQSQAATATIVVTPANVPPQAVNVAPTAANDAFSTAAQTTLSVPAPGLLVNDADSDSPKLTAAKASEPANGSLTVSQDGSFIYVPKPGFFGTDSFTYRATDGSGQSSLATVSLTVTATACGPRPKMLTSPVADGRQLQVRLESTPTNTRQNNALKQITFGTPQNARVTFKGQPVLDEKPILLPPDTHAIDFTVERLVPGQPATVPFSVVDGCGEWKSFVGGGAAAGF